MLNSKIIAYTGFKSVSYLGIWYNNSFYVTFAQCRKNPYTEHYEKIKVDEFLNLKRLAIVLETLVDSFPGMLSFKYIIMQVILHGYMHTVYSIYIYMEANVKWYIKLKTSVEKG